MSERTRAFILLYKACRYVYPHVQARASSLLKEEDKIGANVWIKGADKLLEALNAMKPYIKQKKEAKKR